jgi:hypothetical protein
MRNYLIRFFHIVIIANLFLFFSGCGYKSAPVYQGKNKFNQYLSKSICEVKVNKIANI